MTNNDFYNIGFAIDAVGQSQEIVTLSASSIEAINKNYKISIAIFYQNIDWPSVPIPFGRFPLNYATTFKGHLFCTSVQTLGAVWNASLPKLYYYMQDVEYLRPWCNIQNFNEIMADKSIMKIFRSEDHYNKLKLDGYDVDRLIVKDFDIKGLLEIINEVG